MHPKRRKQKWKKLKDDNSKKKRKAILNVIEVEELLELEQINSKLNLLERKSKIIVETDLKACEELFHLKI